MALKLGELVAYLRTDNDRFRRGLKEAQDDFRGTGEKLERQAVTAGEAMGAGLWRGADGRLRDARGRFAAFGAAAGVESAIGFGTKFGGMLPDSVGKIFGSLPPQAQAAVAAAGVAIGVTLAAAAGTAITAGILLAVGGGVLAAGIIAAAKSPAVQGAWKKFSDRAKAAFADFGKPFEGPLTRAANTFGGALERMAPTLKSMGASMAPIIDKLAPALASLAEKSLPGIKKAVEASKPLFDTIAKHAPEIGDALSDFFDSIAKGGPGANKFLDDFLNMLQGSIRLLGWVVMGLAKIYEVARPVWVGVIAVFRAGVKVILTVLGTIIEGAAAAFGWIPGIGPKLKNAATEFKKFRDKANAFLGGIEDETVQVTVEVHERMFGKPGTTIGGIGGKGFKGLAHGGPALAGHTYWVGENGPELLTMGSQSGTITPNHALGGSGGGVPEVHVYIGDEELRGLVRVEVSERDRGLKRRVTAGAGAR